MKEVFTNFKGDIITFTDTQMEYKTNPDIRFIPYDKLTKAKCGLFEFSAVGDGKEIIFIPDGDQKNRLKEFAKVAISNPKYFSSISKDEASFINRVKVMLRFTDKGIERHSSIPDQATHLYNSIKEIKVLGSNLVSITLKGTQTAIFYNFDEKDKARLKKTIDYVTRRIKTEDKTKEYRMRCNVCGHVFCYTNEDLRKNRSNATLSAISAVGGVASTMGGTIFHTHHLQGQADRYADKIIDYNRCPACHSNNIVELKEDETIQPTQNIPTNEKVSPADELKKFKELLDMGVITQEEFDAKKKQLLGL